LLYTYGAMNHRISLLQFVQLTSTNPAKIFGLYPQKGTIAVGSDADIVLWNPEVDSRISLMTQFQNCDSNIYGGIEISGKLEYVFVKGEIAFQKGKIIKDHLKGEYLR